MSLAKIIAGAKECAEWCDVRNHEDTSDTAESGGYEGSGLDWTPEAMEELKRDCEGFYSMLSPEAQVLVDENPEQAGHDFHLTRNEHGAGFWDGDWPEPYGRGELTKAARSFGESYYATEYRDGLLMIGNMKGPSDEESAEC